MKNVEQRAKFDDFELEDNYDFSDGIHGRFYKPKKTKLDGVRSLKKLIF